MAKMIDAQDIQRMIEDEIEKARGNILTREQAIKRIRDIRDSKSCGHLIDTEAKDRLDACFGSSRMSWGAELELMAIFDIKEEELK